MADMANQIVALTTGKGMSAADMTHLTKVVGDGNMQHGYRCIVEYCEKTITRASQKAFSKGRNIGRKEGVVIGVIGTFAMFGITDLISYGFSAYQKKDQTKSPEEIEATRMNELGVLKQSEKTNIDELQDQSVIVQNAEEYAMQDMKHIGEERVKVKRSIGVYRPRKNMATNIRYPGEKNRRISGIMP